jgi:hypothetical protein
MQPTEVIVSKLAVKAALVGTVAFEADDSNATAFTRQEFTRR